MMTEGGRETEPPTESLWRKTREGESRRIRTDSESRVTIQ